MGGAPSASKRNQGELMSDYTPTMARIEDMYAWAYAWRTQDDPGDDETDLSHLRASQRAEFQRALAAHERKIAAEAWDEGYGAGFTDGNAKGRWADDDNPYREAGED